MIGLRHRVGDIITLMFDTTICQDFYFVSCKNEVRPVGNPNSEILTLELWPEKSRRSEMITIPGCRPFRTYANRKYKLHSKLQAVYVEVSVISKRRKGEPVDKEAPWYRDVEDQYRKEVKQ